MVSRHEDVRTVLNDRRFSADRQHPDFPQLVKGEAAARRPDEERTLIAMDAPEHGPARRAVLGEFTVRRLEALRPRIQEIVDGQIDALLAGPRPGDLVTTLGGVVGPARGPLWTITSGRVAPAQPRTTRPGPPQNALARTARTCRDPACSLRVHISSRDLT
ncbi:hypothetical protein LX83_001092 [Goodfellowiella coeruleoviolacea]|uniref:Cytochrome P450 n=1 Tax=Goodfellowiella coeruleoviolacea TaxID=334858 RepID=A0AAE3G9Q2_9PSEU|nr:hypothetical protein [Goodfellowiella coeruleoviolacea]